MRKKKNIILIDDDHTTNTLNKLIIEQSALVDDVIMFSDPEEALAYFSSSNDDGQFLIFLDINMPVMDGWEFIDEYAKLGVDSESKKIVMLTSSIDPSDMMKAEEMQPVADFKSKPLSVEMLTLLVQKYMN